jgi:DNA-binding LytR/AlgR family response regulator
MLRCIVVDDEAAAIEVLESYIEQAPQLELAASFRDPLKAFAYLESEEIDVGFFDINMPGLSGLQLAQLVRDKGISIIFCTAHADYALESYELPAVDYLLKPISFDRFLKAVAKVQRQDPIGSSHGTTSESKSKDNLFVKSGPKIHQLRISDLLYMKKDGHYVMIVTEKESLLSRMNVAELLDMLPPDNFQQVHKSFVVALNKITLVDRHFLMIKNEEIPIGGNFRKALLDRIDYSGS